MAVELVLVWACEKILSVQVVNVAAEEGLPQLSPELSVQVVLEVRAAAAHSLLLRVCVAA